MLGAALTPDASESSRAVFGIDLDALGGTAAQPASVNAADDALLIFDTAATASTTKIQGFGADDRLELIGVTTGDVDLKVGDGYTRVTIEDGQGTLSLITLLGISGAYTSVDAFNANTDSGEIL